MVKGHDCRDFEVERRATAEQPYHFVHSGLSNVFLTGVRYYVCQECGRQSAAIPAVNALLTVIARELVRQPSLLRGEEIRFLRKQLGRKSADFAVILDVSPETYSRWENGKQRPSPMADSLIRLYYTLESRDADLLREVQSTLDKIVGHRQRGRRAPQISARIKGKDWAVLPRVAA